VFEPVSDIEYLIVSPDAQVLVCTLADSKKRPALLPKWQGRAAAFFEFHAATDLPSLIRDLLANPQIRVVVVDGAGARVALDDFWHGTEVVHVPGVALHHVELVRHYVNLFDEDCRLFGPLPPYWPHRLRYTASKSSEDSK
jgi:hypothetical protein